MEQQLTRTLLQSVLDQAGTGEEVMLQSAYAADELIR
jgi:hypothetical protein